MCSAQADVRFVPIADIWPGLFWLGLFHHLIGALLHLQRHIEAQSLHGLEVDHQLVLGRRLHWRVTRLLAFESPVQPDSGPPILLNCAKDSVRYR
jgi:hypothetical protein